MPWVSKFEFDYHLKSCGSYSTYSWQCNSACSKLAFGTTRGYGWSGKHHRHQVYHWRHHCFSESSNQVFLHSTEGKCLKLVQFSWRCFKFQHFRSKKMPKAPNDCSTYGDKSIETLLQHYDRELPAQSVVGDKFVMLAFVNSDLPTEWKTYWRYNSKSAKGRQEWAVKRVVP